MKRPLLLAVIEIGGYPNFASLYEKAGFEVLVETRMRKAMSIIKQKKPRLIVAEFNFQSDFRDRTSSLESMMSVVERLPNSDVIVFFEQEYAHQFERLLAVHSFYRSFTFPISEDALAACVTEVALAWSASRNTGR